jgi:glycosyltransferase involved in cell wall biosynthesis
MKQDSTQKIKVLYLVSLFPCWSETFIVREIRQLQRLGVDVRIFSYKHPSEALVQSDTAALMGSVIYPGSLAHQVRAFFCSLIRYPLKNMRVFRRIIAGLWHSPMQMLKTLAVYWRGHSMMQQLGDWRPDLMHAHWATYPSSGAMFLSALHDLPYGFTCHAHDIFLDDHFIADKLDSATHAVTISKYNQQYLEKLYGNLADSMHIVHCGIDLTAYQFLQAGRNKAHIVAVGRLIPMKGFRVLIEALALLKSRNVDFQCDIVGDGPLRDDLTKLVDQNGLQEVLRLRGALPQEDVRGLIEKATVFVMPSTIANDGDRDGIPVALMEAMALGTPVLSTRVSGIPE